MTTSMIVKVTIDEFATPGLFRAVSAVPNPRQRASLLKRLAEDALRNTVPTSQIVPAATSVTAGNSVIPRAVRSGAAPTSYSTPGGLFLETGVFDEDQRQFGYKCTADDSSAASVPQTRQSIVESRPYLVTEASSPRETVASLVSIAPDCKASATNSTEKPTMPAQPLESGEMPYRDTITQSSRTLSFLTRALVTAALAMEKSGYRLRRSIIGRGRRLRR